MLKNLPVTAGNAREAGSNPESRELPGVGNGNPLQYSCPEISMERGALVGYSPWGYKRV